ncbi:MAG TPA: EamA family transporter [Vicinamibacterales bacterium]|nr:EamA family transporter [Vicinamibacterales bacterium]
MSARHKAYAAWTAVCLIWGTTYLGIRICLETMPPFLMGGLRWVVAGTMLAAFLAARGVRMPPRESWGTLTVLGFLLLVLGNGGVVWAEQWVPSGLTAVIVASSPFWMVGVERAVGGERLTARTLAGLSIGFAGIVLLVWPELTSSAIGFGAGVLALQLACLGWALGSSYSKRHMERADALAVAAGEMIAGGLIMLAAGTVLGEWPALHFTPRTAIAFLYLATIGAVGGFVAYTYALKHLPIAFVSLYAYINPIIAVVLGVVVLDEPFTARRVSAAAIVFAGVALVQTRQRRA